MEVPPADLKQRLATAARSTPALALAARERRRAAERRSLRLHRPAVEKQLAATERRLRPLRLMALGRALGLLALPAILITSLMEVAPPANLNLVDVGLPYTLLMIALLTVTLWPYAFRPYMLLTRAFLLRALLTYALMEETGQTGDLLIRSLLSRACETALGYGDSGRWCPGRQDPIRPICRPRGGCCGNGSPVRGHGR
jgi:hypothetical protein